MAEELDIALQKRELVVIENMFFKKNELDIRSSEYPISGRVRIPIFFPTNEPITIVFRTYLRDGTINDICEKVDYLPPIELYFSFPSDYPSGNKPSYVLRCPWISDEGLYLVTVKFEHLWQENMYEPIMLTWTDFVSHHLLNYLYMNKSFGIICGDLPRHYKTNGEPVFKLTFVNRSFAFQEYQKTKEQPSSKTGCGKKSDGNKKKKNRRVSMEYVKLNSGSIKFINTGDKDAMYKYETPKEVQARAVVPKTETIEEKRYAIVVDWDREYLEESDTGVELLDDAQVAATAMTEADHAKAAYAQCDKQDGGHIYMGDVDKIGLIGQMREYNETNSYIFDLHECEICCEKKCGIHRFKPCDHKFCKDCVREYLNTEINNGTAQKARSCPMTDCVSPMPLTLVKKLLSEEAFRKFENQALNYTLTLNKYVTYCPQPSCQCVAFVETIDKEPIGHCIRCQFYFCTYCRKLYHGVNRCHAQDEDRARILAEYKKGSPVVKKDLEKCYSKRRLEKWVEEDLSEEWKLNNSKKCPKCEAIIEKTSGCNKVVCYKCGTFFCYLCLTILKEKDAYDHFLNRDSETSCTGKLYPENMFYEQLEFRNVEEMEAALLGEPDAGNEVVVFGGDRVYVLRVHYVNENLENRDDSDIDEDD